MARTVFTTTISLPKSMASDLKEMSRKEGMTTSELVREALRSYKRMRRYHTHGQISWTELQGRLKRVSRSGRRSNLAEFIARDRLVH